MHFDANLPPQLESIINKCLEKHRDLRYQHAADIRTDLKRLQRDTDSIRSTGAGDAIPAGTVVADRPSSRAVIFEEAKRHKSGLALVVAGLVVIVVALKIYFPS